jgi:predicted dehydrogenase
LTAVNWGVLGCARIAETALIPAILAAEGARLFALSARDGARAEAWAARYGADRAYEGYDALLADPDVEAVYIPLATAHHVAWTMNALAAGKHVLCEKPIALKAAQIDQIIDARDTLGLLAAEAFMVAHHPQWAQVRDWIAAGEIGALRHVQGAFSYRNLDPDNMRNQTALGGGALLDIGVYPIVTTRLVTGQEPRRTQARIERDPTFGTDRYANVTMEFDGFDLSFYVATQLALRQTMVFHGETGWIEVRAPFNTGLYGIAEVALNRAAREETVIRRWQGVDHYRLMVEAFGRSLREGAPFAFPLESSRANQEAIDSCFEAGEGRA